MPASKTVTKGLSAAATKLFNDDGTLHPQAEGAVTKLLNAQRPVVLAYIRSVRRRNPNASPEEIIELLGKYYVNLVTGGGAVVGATAAVPGLGTVAGVSVAAVETAGFLEATALYAQSVAEMHGLPVRDPLRSNALTMGLMLGGSGRELIDKFANKAGGGFNGNDSWGTLVVSSLPAQIVGTLTKRMRTMMFKKFAGRTAGSFVGRILPFGVGAVVGAVVNRKMAKLVVENSAKAFGGAPVHFEPETEPTRSTPTRDADIVSGLRNFWELTKRRRAQKRDEAQVVTGDVIDPTDSTSVEEDESPRTHSQQRSRFSPKNLLL